MTASMAPLVRPGDRVLVHKASPEQISFGDIMVFRRNGDLIVHRVLKKWQTSEGLWFREKGDVRYVYGTVCADSVVGRVMVVSRGGKTLNLASPLSRTTSRAFTTWLCLSCSIIVWLKRSHSKTAQRVVFVLSRALFLGSNIFVRACFPIWYASRLEVMEEGEAVPERLGGRPPDKAVAAYKEED